MSLGRSRPLFPTANPAGMLMRSFARAKGRIHIVGPHIIRRVGSVLERARVSSRTAVVGCARTLGPGCRALRSDLG